MNEVTDQEQPISASGLAAVLNVSARTVKRWAKRGDIPSEHDGHSYSFYLSQVKEALRQQYPSSKRTGTVGVAEIAAEFRRTPNTVRLWAAHGIIPGAKKGRIWQFDIEEVRTALRANPWVVNGMADIGPLDSLLAESNSGTKGNNDAYLAHHDGLPGAARRRDHG